MENPNQTGQEQKQLPPADTAAPAQRPPADISDEAFISVFQNERAFEAAQRMAKALHSSDMVPIQYQGQAKMGNCLIALEIAQRSRVNVLAVMQNLHVIHGRPSWSAQYVIAALNTCGRFEPLEFVWQGEEGSDDYGCRATARVKRTGVLLRSSLITIGMAKAEGWYGKTGSKWKTMPEQMLQYRAASFFGKIHAPEVLNGMQTKEEVEDAIDIETLPPKIDRIALPAPEQAASDKPAPAEKPAAAPTGGVSRARKTRSGPEKQGELETEQMPGDPAPAKEPVKQAEKQPEKPAEKPSEKKAEPVEEKKPEPAPAPAEAPPAADDDMVEDDKAPPSNSKAVEITASKTGTKASNQEKVYILEVSGEHTGKVFMEKVVYFIGDGKPDKVPSVGEKVFVDLEERPGANGPKFFITGWRSQF